MQVGLIYFGKDVMGEYGYVYDNWSLIKRAHK
jgi:hypothetical protein